MAKASRPLEAMNPPVGRAESRNCQSSQEGAVGVETIVVLRWDSGVGGEVMLSRGKVVGVVAADIEDVLAMKKEGRKLNGCCRERLFGRR